MKVGEKIIENYLKDPNKTPGGSCFKVVYDRVAIAYKQVCNTTIPAVGTFSNFDRLWGSKIDPKASWQKLPELYRAKGPAGALVQKRMGELIKKDQIWKGSLEKGAVVQTWKLKSDYELVKNGDVPKDIGHSFIFLEYVKDRHGKCIAMHIADQGTIWSRASGGMTSTEFEYWVAAHVKCK